MDSLEAELEIHPLESSDWQPVDISRVPEPEAVKPVDLKPAEPMPWEVDEPAKKPKASLDIAEWLKDMEEHEAEVSKNSKDIDWLSSVYAPEGQVTNDYDELPDWLKDPIVEEEQPAPQPETVQPAALEAIPAQQNNLETPDVTLSQPAVEETPARVEPEPVAEAVPVAVEDSPAAKSEPVEHSTPARPQTTGNEKDMQALQKAREMMSHSRFSDSMNEYSRMIRKGKMLEDVIYDLQEAVYRHPVDVITWQTLGDAYFKANQLQEALDAYGKAEGLLR